jgi:glycosyltransferase involved in cell wall biosynthesis
MITYIVPCYNNMYTIENCLLSIYNQICKYTIEIIVIDDHSTDESLVRIQNLLSKYNRPNRQGKVIHNLDNYGCYISINIGLKNMNLNNKFFSYISADDYIHPMKTIHTIQFMDKNNLILCGCQSLNRDYSAPLNSTIIYPASYTYSTRILHMIGYFYENRFGSDDEYIYRLKKFLKKNRELEEPVHIPNIYYFTIGSNNSLTTQYDNEERMVWWKQITETIEREDIVFREFDILKYRHVSL